MHRNRKSRTDSSTNNGPVKNPKTTTESTKSDSKPQPEKAQPTAEQMRIAQIIDTKNEDPSLKDKIKQVMDATQKSEDEVCTALHDCDNDPDRAVNLLLEGSGQGQWSTRMKKKKKTPGEKQSSKDTNLTHDDSDIDGDQEDGDREKPLTNAHNTESKGKGPNKNKSQDKNWKGKESKENEKNLASGRGRSKNRNVMNGPNRGRVSSAGRGRGRGRMFMKPMETWDAQTANCTTAAQVEDWDNEEYTGSLADSKVFTSSSASGDSPAQQETAESQEKKPLTNATDEQRLQNLQYLSQFTNSNQPPSSKANCNSVFHDSSHFARDMASNPLMKYGVMFNSNEQNNQENSLPQRYPPVGRGQLRNLAMGREIRLPRSKARPRIPPPSKIPSSAVEMPPETVGTTMDLLDFQFGAMEFSDPTENLDKSSGPLSSPIRRSPATTDTSGPSEKAVINPQVSSSSDGSLLINDSSGFSSVRSSVSSSLPLNELSSKVGTESISSGLYQDSVVYQSSHFNKTSHPSQAAPFSSTTNFSTPQVTSSGGVYSLSNTGSNYSSSSVGYNNSYPSYPTYGNYQSQQPVQLPNTTSFQTASQYGGSVYGASTGIGSTNSTISYSSTYPSYMSSTPHNHKSSTLSSVNSGKEFDSTTPTVNLPNITATSAISASQSLLSSTTPATTSKPTSTMNTISKGPVVPANMPPGVGIVGTTQYIMSQGGVPTYFQPQLYGGIPYEEVSLLSQQRLPHMPYYEVNYPPTTREGIQYNMSDARYARADNNTSPVSNISQQSGTQGHQQPLINPPAIPPGAYAAYFYGGSMIPGNFQYSGPPIYPVAATGAGSGHSTTNSAYGKGPTTYTAGYSTSFDGNSQGTSGDFKGTTQVPKTQPSQNNPTTSEMSTMYSKSHSHVALSKMNSYDKQGYCPTPPPFNIGSQSSGIGPGATPGFPQHLFIPAMGPHNTTLMHQPLQQDGSNAVSGRTQVGSQQNKVAPKPTYSSTNFWHN